MSALGYNEQAARHVQGMRAYNMRNPTIKRCRDVIIVACSHPLSCCIYSALVSLLFITFTPIIVHLILVHTTYLVSDSMVHVQECCIHAALVSLLFGLVIPRAFNIMEMFLRKDLTYFPYFLFLRSSS